jgi:hypothetical protein
MIHKSGMFSAYLVSVERLRHCQKDYGLGWAGLPISIAIEAIRKSE